jgi:hypothetical protein
MKWIVGQYMNSVSQYVNFPVDQETLNTNIQFTPHLWDAQISDYRFLVVEDEYRNLFEMTRNFATRARAQGFINVISESYFLREYMLDHPDLFINDRKAIPTIVPDYARTERNTVLKLMMLLLASPIPEQTLLNELRFLPATEEDPFVHLPQIIAKHVRLDNVPLSLVYKEEYDADGMSFVMNKYLKLELTPEIRKYMVNLRNAYYIAEDEIGGKYYVGAKLYGHVYQTFLPGQFFTFSGKYYEVISISETIGVVVRRAADHIARRRYYKQMQTVAITHWVDSQESGSFRTIDDIMIHRGYGNVEISTQGYLELANHGDLKTAQIVKLRDIPTRLYKYKQLLRIQLPDCPMPVRYTICTLLNEMFKTYYPDTYYYIQACTDVSPQWIEEHSSQESARYLLNQLQLDGEDDSIYLIEDSELDLGLIVSVDRNLRRFFETMTDVLQWYISKDGLTVAEPKESTEPSEPSEPTEQVEPEVTELPPEDVFINEDEELKKESASHPKYLNFGFSEVPKTLQIQSTLEYLSRFGFQHNYLQQARASRDIAQEIERTYQPQLAGEHYCDFCAVQLSSMQFEVLQDGRERCLECSQTAIKTAEEFKQIFQWVRRNMEAFFGIKIQTSIKVRTTNAKKISRILGKVFIPTPGFDGRPVGIAIQDRSGHSIYVEVGAPRLSIIAVMAHELTHIWQYLHWNRDEIKQNFGGQEDIAYEGLAMWAEIQFMILMNEVAYAKREEMVTRLRDDVYGVGFREMAKRYPLQYSTRLHGATPFQKIPPYEWKQP